MNTIIVKKDGYIYNGKYIKDLSENITLNEFGKKRRIIVLEEAVLVKINIKTRKEVLIEEFVDKIIKGDFSKDKDLLFNYEYNKKTGKVYIYAIKNGLLVDKVLKGARDAKVDPIQYVVKNIIERQNKSMDNYICIIKIEGVYYFIHVENGYIVNAEIDEKEEYIEEYLNKNKVINKLLIFDSALKDSIDKYKLNFERIEFINIGDKINVKISEKQGISPKRIFRRKKE